MLSDTVWEWIAPHLPGKASDRGVTAKDNRLFLEAVSWRARHRAIGRSKGGLTTKIVVPVDALGNPVWFVLPPGRRNDMIGVRPLIEAIHFDALLDDKAFDADWLRAEPDDRGALAVIPPPAATGNIGSITTRICIAGVT